MITSFSEEDDKVIRLHYTPTRPIAGADLQLLYQDELVRLYRLTVWIGMMEWIEHLIFPGETDESPDAT
ncbi:hypothetical protein J8F10_24155 [Gemmata sp. G18]|uniref:Uncharacterized protein n=1 Tax=Gemmata palustris TaxID=2822762 RepID=A0ABS5BXC4_9BACT|nr:hypothetical protein [Gemmata palustris]MBP3958354.1 hypothetical protein [Gemmata palustris]